MKKVVVSGIFIIYINLEQEKIIKLNPGIFILTALLACASGGKAESLTIYTELSGTIQFRDQEGGLDGIGIEIVKAIQRKIGDSAAIQVVPWARGYNALESSPNVMLFSTTWTKQRSSLFKWVGPILTNSWALFARRGSLLKIDTLEDARKVKLIGTYKDDSREQFLLQLGFRNLESVADNILNVRKLMAGRIDLLIGTVEGVGYTIAKAGFSENNLELKFIIGKHQLYLAFSRQTPDETVRKWEEGLRALHEDGTMERIYRRWKRPLPPPQQVFSFGR